MKRESYGRLIMTIGILLMVIAGAVGCSLTTEKTQQEAQKIKKTDVKTENKDGEIMSKNPLTKETTPEFTKAVEKYYESLADKTDYIEGYEGIEVYKKEFLGGTRTIVPEKNILIDNSFKTRLIEEQEQFAFTF